MSSCPTRKLYLRLPKHYISGTFDIIIPCVAYTHDPNATLTVDLKVKFTRSLTCLRVRPVTYVCFDIGTLVYQHETMCCTYL